MNSPENNRCCGNGSWVGILAAIGGCLIFAFLVFKMREYTTPAPLGAERAAERAKARAEFKALDAESLATAGWVDQGKGLVRLPIDDALVLWENKSRDPASARKELIERATKAAEVPPPPPPEPSPFE